MIRRSWKACSTRGCSGRDANAILHTHALQPACRLSAGGTGGGLAGPCAVDVTSRFAAGGLRQAHLAGSSKTCKQAATAARHESLSLTSAVLTAAQQQLWLLEGHRGAQGCADLGRRLCRAHLPLHFQPPGLHSGTVGIDRWCQHDCCCQLTPSLNLVVERHSVGQTRPAQRSTTHHALGY